MQFGGKIDYADLKDVRKMTVSRMYWLKLLLSNWYGIALLLALLWATISGFVGQTKLNWRALGAIWAVVVGIVLWAVYNTKRSERRDLEQLNSTLPDMLTLTNDGITWDGPSGAKGFLPWHNFNGWREGRRVVLIDQCQGNRFVMLPIAQLSDLERLPIRQFLQSNIASTRKSL